MPHRSVPLLALNDADIRFEEALLMCPLNAGNLTDLLARALNKNTEIREAVADNHAQHMTDLLCKVSIWTDGAAALLDRRLALLAEVASAAKATEKAEKAAIKAPEKQAAAAAARAYEIAQQSSAAALTTSVESELVRVRRLRSATVLAALSDLARAQAASAAAMEASLAQFAAEIRRQL